MMFRSKVKTYAVTLWLSVSLTILLFSSLTSYGYPQFMQANLITATTPYTTLPTSTSFNITVHSLVTNESLYLMFFAPKEFTRINASFWTVLPPNGTIVYRLITPSTANASTSYDIYIAAMNLVSEEFQWAQITLTITSLSSLTASLTQLQQQNAQLKGELTHALNLASLNNPLIMIVVASNVIWIIALLYIGVFFKKPQSPQLKEV
jgi:hypothetical protein